MNPTEDDSGKWPLSQGGKWWTKKAGFAAIRRHLEPETVAELAIRPYNPVIVGTPPEFERQ